MALTQTQLVTAVADRAELIKADANRALTAVEEIVVEEFGNAQNRAHRRVGSADRAGQSGAEEGQRPQPCWARSSSSGRPRSWPEEGMTRVLEAAVERL